MQTDDYARRLERMQQIIIDRIEDIAASAKNQGVDFPSNLQFRAEFQDEEIYVMEINSNFAVPLGKL